MYPEKKGGSHKMARLQQNWGLLTLVTRWASIWTMPNTASSKSEPPCGRAVYTPVRATILGHPPQKTAPGGHLAMTVAESRHNSELASVTIQPLQVLICVTDYPIIIDTSGSLSACHFELVSCRQTDSMNWLTQACGEFVLSGSHSTKPNSSS